jgi:hypothetical protein
MLAPAHSQPTPRISWFSDAWVNLLDATDADGKGSLWSQRKLESSLRGTVRTGLCGTLEGPQQVCGRCRGVGGPCAVATSTPMASAVSRPWEEVARILVIPRPART